MAAAAQLTSLTFHNSGGGLTGKRGAAAAVRVAPAGLSTMRKARSTGIVAAVGDVSADGTTYLIAGAVAVALVGTAFPILFARKDT